MLELTQLRSAVDADFDHLIQLYTDAFPASERKSTSTLHRMLHDASYRFFVAKREETFVGFAIAKHCAGKEVALLEYMAVSPGHREQGLGRELYKAVAGMLRRTSPALLIEVESDHLPGPEQASQARRKAFYHRQGARQIAGLHWLMPAVADTEPPPMDLLLHSDTTSMISKTTLRHWLQSIYVEVYDQPANDARIQAMLALLPDSILLL